MKIQLEYDLDLEKFTQGQNFLNIARKTSQNILGYYAQGINLFLARSKVKVKVEQNVKFT